MKGYRRIGLYLNSGKLKNFMQHRIFMLAFTPNPENESQIDHLDGVKDNNLLSNLEWVSPSTNTKRAYDKGLAKVGERHVSAKLKDSEMPLVFQMKKTGMTLRAIGLRFGVSHVQISRILRGKSRSNLSI